MNMDCTPKYIRKKIAYYIRFDKQLWYRRQQGSKLMADERVRKMGAPAKLLAAQKHQKFV